VKEPGLKIEVSLKGGGSENCSYLKMQNPSINENDIMKLVVDLVRANVTKCCPPVILGIGIGGTASVVTKMARQAAFRDLGIRNSDKRYQMLEQKILEAVNNTGIGPQGLGGMTTAIGCNIEFAPCHIATLPVAVFIQCHSLRRASSKISPP
jgi:fumarate hydratase subunit alpha